MSKLFIILNSIYFSYMYIGDGKDYKDNRDFFRKGNVSKINYKKIKNYIDKSSEEGIEFLNEMQM